MSCFRWWSRKENVPKLPEIKSSFVSLNNQSFNEEDYMPLEFSTEKLAKTVLKRQKDYQLEFKFSDVKYFLQQNIFEIRIRNRLYEDDQFIRDISSIADKDDSTLGLSLVSRFKAKSLSDLNRLIKWQRAQVIKIT